MDLTTDYPFLIAVYLVLGLVFQNRTKRDFLPGRRTPFFLTYYGLFSAIGVFMALMIVSRCDMNLFFIVLVALAPIFLRFLFCRDCSKTYNVTMVYAAIIPAIVLLYPCKEIAAIAVALAVGTAIGRLGCLSAGCCTGETVSCNKFNMSYNDPEQLINIQNGTKSTCTKPTSILETVVQFVIAGLCLRFPAYSPMIFGFGTSALVALSELWRKRFDTRAVALILLVLPLACFGKVTSVCSGNPNFIFAFFAAVAAALFFSFDVMLPDPEKN